jgi:hypothetical protein
MIDVKEHVYDDDPHVGPADVRTELAGVDYFFLGNGLIQAAVQSAPSGDGTPIGLLIMDPERLRKKREALTMDARSGLESTALHVISDPGILTPAPGEFTAAWSSEHRLPAVRVRWGNSALNVEELFYCPVLTEPVLVRELRFKNRKRRPAAYGIRTGVPGSILEKRISLKPGGEKRLFIRYILDSARDRVRIEWTSRTGAAPETIDHWRALARIEFGHDMLDHFFKASKSQLPAVIARSGRLDGGVWQYNREWLRDQAVIALALTMIGEHTLAGTMFNRLFDRFVTSDGDTIDSSEKRNPDEVELDQNGFLLYTFKDFVLWTGDLSLGRKHWDKIVAAAEFPLKDIFRHRPSGLLTNRREFWERHRAHGIEPGLELVHQLYTAVGLNAAAVLARRLGHGENALRWDREALRIKTAMLEDPRFRMFDGRGFIKRRSLDGSVQEMITAQPGSGLPAEAPLAKPGDHFLNPDTSTALPIALEFVPSDSPLCRSTMASLETLWNQTWKSGGYGRYHASSEPDSPGAWPFPSLFAARAYVEMGRSEDVWRILNWLAAVPGSGAGTWFEFYGKRLAPPFPQVGIVPWSWAEMIILIVHHILGVQPQEDGLRLRPRLLPGLDRGTARFPFRKGRLELSIKRMKKAAPTKFRSEGKILAAAPGEALFAYPARDLKIDVRI